MKSVVFKISPAQYPNNSNILWNLMKDMGELKKMENSQYSFSVRVPIENKEIVQTWIDKRYDPMQDAWDLEGKIYGYSSVVNT